MADKSIKTRVQMKRGTSAEWALATGFKPLDGESIFYTDLNKIKVGKYKDGTTDAQKKSVNHTDYLIPLDELPFLDARDADTLDGKHASEFALKANVPTSFAPVDAEKNVQSDWNVTDTNSDAFIKNKPTIPTVNNATLTIQKNGTNVATFTANSASNATANITVPTKTSELTNDSGFKTVDNNQTVKTGSVTFGANDVVEFVAGSNVSISGDATNKKITISSTDTNTETTLTITDKTNTDTADLVYAVTNVVEGGTKGHAITPTYTGLPTKTYVDKVATGHVKYLGTVSAITGLATTAGQGDFYRVSTQFTFGSETAHVGDILLAAKDNPAQNTTDWDLIHTEVDSNTWVANSSTADGYVAKTNGAANKVWKTNASGVPSWQDDANTDTGATSVEVTGTGNAVTTASYNATNRKLTLTKGATYVTKTEVDALISSGTADPTASTASQYYFKYN